MIGRHKLGRLQILNLSFLFVLTQSHKARKRKKLIKTQICFNTNHISFPKVCQTQSCLVLPSTCSSVDTNWISGLLLLSNLYLCTETQTSAILLYHILFLSMVVLCQLYRKHTLALNDYEFLFPSKKGGDFRCTMNIPIEVHWSPGSQILVPHK